MTQFVPPPDPKEAEAHLTTLLHEVNTWGGQMHDGEAPPGVQDIQKYRQAKIDFTNPKSNLERLTPAMFDKVGVQLSAHHAEQMRHRFDFYTMTLSVQMRPEPGTFFRALGCQLNFGPPGDKEPIVVSIFPDEQWQEVYNFGGSLRLNLDANLGFEVGLEGMDTAAAQNTLVALPANLQSKVVNQNEMRSTIQIPAFSYSRGRFKIAAYGPDGSKCYWYLDNDEIAHTLTARFTIVFKVPQGTQAISLTGFAWAEPDMDKLTANFRHVINKFQDALLNLFRGSNKGAREFAITAPGQWDNLLLPAPAPPPAAPIVPEAAAGPAGISPDLPLNHLQITSQMGKLITKWFSEDELHTLCLDIGYHYENLPGRSKPERAQELALLTQRHNKFEDLRNYCKSERPHVNWDID